MFPDFASAFLKLFVIMDAIGVLPMFLLLSERMPRKERAVAADRTVMISAFLMVLFLFLGLGALSFFGITLGGFQVAGGLILLVLGIKIVLGMRFSVQEKQVDRYAFSAVPMATPLIIGPGTITTLVILTGEYGYVPVLLAGIANVAVMWVVLRYATAIYKLIGHQGTEVVSRMMGIVFTALAVEFIKEGLLKMV